MPKQLPGDGVANRQAFTREVLSASSAQEQIPISSPSGPRKTPVTLLAAIIAACSVGVGTTSHGQSIQVSAAMPVTNQTVMITVAGLAQGGAIDITDSHAVTTQLTADAQSQAAWTPTRYGKYSISAGAATQTLWVTARPMTFHWWNCTTAQTNVTAVMQRDSAWQARGVTRVDWTGGEAYSRGVDGHYWTNAPDWFNGWNYAYSTDGMAIDEAYCDAGFPTDPILQAIAQVRQAQGTNYSINLWSDGFGDNFAAGAALLQSNNITILVEDYSGTWSQHTSRWADVRSYGLQNQAFPGIWPGTAPLTNEAAVRADMALIRLAAPEANGIAIFAPGTNSFTPPELSSVLDACDQAIEDYYLKPLIHLTLNSSGQVVVWNLGNDDAAGFSLHFLDGSGGVVQTVDLSSLTAIGQWLLAIPGGAVNARLVNPSGTANLYTGNSQYTTGLFPLIVPGRYVWSNANGDNLWSTSSNWNPHGPPPGNIDSGNFAYFDGAVLTPHTVIAASAETSINSVQFVTGGWTIAGNATNQDFYAYSITSAGTGTNTIDIGISARDVVPALFTVGTGNTLVMNGLVGAARHSGGLVKNGPGTLLLTYTNTYTGGTTVNAGTLLISSTGALPATAVTVHSGATLGGNGTINGAVTLQSGATLAPGLNGIGTLTLNATPSLAGTTLMEISKGAAPNADQLVISGQPLAYGGTLTVTSVGASPLAVGDSFTLFAASTYSNNFTTTNLPALPSNLHWAWSPAGGNLSVVANVSTTPPRITNSVSGHQLTLTWPADHTGWRLQGQTNGANTGLTRTWYDVPNSATTNQFTVPLDSANGSSFYRLVYP
jgi:autotransporter-associated beta strand protein